MAARLAPDNVRQTHQSLHHLVADAPWSDEALLEQVRHSVLPAMKRETITFHVPGAGVQLDGFYNMKSGDMDFRGHLLLDDKLSQTTTGATSVFLRVVDPFFKRKGGGSSIPIKVTGNYAHPSFGIDLGGNHKGK
jgi:hypothetical protein